MCARPSRPTAQRSSSSWARRWAGRPTSGFDAFFSWKHDDNPVGRSPAWVAVGGQAIVGFRTFTQWEYRAGSGEALQTVRAVDIAMHPAYQGRGIFRRSTLEAHDALRAAGLPLSGRVAGRTGRVRSRPKTGAGPHLASVGIGDPRVQARLLDADPG